MVRAFAGPRPSTVQRWLTEWTKEEIEAAIWTVEHKRPEYKLVHPIEVHQTEDLIPGEAVGIVKVHDYNLLMAQCLQVEMDIERERRLLDELLR
jgi:hypothetical protein